MNPIKDLLVRITTNPDAVPSWRDVGLLAIAFSICEFAIAYKDRTNHSGWKK